MKFEDGVKLDFDDVLIKPKRSTLTSRSKVDIKKTYRYLHASVEETITPIVAANMDTVGTMAMAEKLEPEGMQACLHKYYCEDELTEFFKQENARNTFYTIGIKQEDVDKLLNVKDALLYAKNEYPSAKAWINEGFKISKICIDVANGYQKVFVNHVKRIRDLFPDAVIMAGNVCTPEMVSELLISGGADVIKIGIGPGSVCTTRKITGCGYPQLSAIIECADAAHGIGGLICADGGCKEPGDVVKAFAAGADFVMLGGMLAGTDECEGEWEHEGWTHSPCGMRIGKGIVSDPDKKKSLKFYGMSSEEAMNKHNGGVATYKASEGTVKTVDYRGPVQNVLQEITGGIRSACAYVGANTLKDFPKCATFVRVA